MISLTAHCTKTATLISLTTALFCNLGVSQELNAPRTEIPGSASLPIVSVLETGFSFGQEPQVEPSSPNLSQASESLVDPSGGRLSQLPEDLEVLTRGQLHEAFATAHQSNPNAAPLVRKSPPELIDELPPEYKPEGTNVQWIPGYWAWDDSQNDFIWISGVWRDVPPQRRWVPGYWEQSSDGHRWVSGLWAEEQQQELGYLPAPPTSIDQGPSTLAPSENHFYVPGNWEYQNNHYRWMSGHWQPVVENWIWIPARYVWTPSGCVYQSGYWDYEFDQRGTCFAPVHFNRPVYQEASYHYRPSYAINLNIDFLTHLFVRPNCGHYFYGDWYSSGFANSGYRPWSSYRSHARSYDPLLTYYRSRRSSFDVRLNTVQYLANQQRFYAQNRDYRPRPTFSAQLNVVNNHRQGQHSNYHSKSSYVRSYSSLLRDAQRDRERRERELQSNNSRLQRELKQNQIQFQRIREDEQLANRRQLEQLEKIQRDRRKSEARQVSATRPTSQKPKSGSYRLSPQISQYGAKSTRKPSSTANAGRNGGRETSKLTTSRNQSSESLRRQQIEASQRILTIQRSKSTNSSKLTSPQARSSVNNAKLDQVRRQQASRQRDAQLQQRRDEEKRKYDLARRQRDQELQAKQRQRLAQDRARRQQLELDKQRRAQDAAQKARERQQRDQAIRAQVDQKRRQEEAAQKARKAQQEQARRDSVRRAQQKAQQDAARRIQEKTQRDAARRAQQARDAAKQDQRRREAAQRAQQSKRARDAKKKKK